MRIHWLAEPEEHTYSAAYEYMSLLLAPARAQRLAERFRKADTVRFKAKDLLRASQLPLLGFSKDVLRDTDRIDAHEPLSPILLVRGAMGRGMSLQVVDGYPRLCAVYWADEDAEVACRMIDLDW